MSLLSIELWSIFHCTIDSFPALLSSIGYWYACTYQQVNRTIPRTSLHRLTSTVFILVGHLLDSLDSSLHHKTNDSNLIFTSTSWIALGQVWIISNFHHLSSEVMLIFCYWSCFYAQRRTFSTPSNEWTPQTSSSTFWPLIKNHSSWFIEATVTITLSEGSVWLASLVCPEYEWWYCMIVGPIDSTQGHLFVCY